MQTKTRRSWAVFKAGEGQFVRCNDAKANKRNRQGVPMKQRDAEQGQRKQDEFEWNPEGEGWLGQFHLGRVLTDPNSLWFRYNKSTVAPEANSRVLCPLWIISGHSGASALMSASPSKADVG